MKTSDINKLNNTSACKILGMFEDDGGVVCSEAEFFVSEKRAIEAWDDAPHFEWLLIAALIVGVDRFKIIQMCGKIVKDLCSIADDSLIKAVLWMYYMRSMNNSVDKRLIKLANGVAEYLSVYPSISQGDWYFDHKFKRLIKSLPGLWEKIPERYTIQSFTWSVKEILHAKYGRPTWPKYEYNIGGLRYLKKWAEMVRSELRDPFIDRVLQK